MANTRKKTAVERLKLSLWAKKREETKRALRAVADKPDSLLPITGQQTGVPLPADRDNSAQSKTNYARNQAGRALQAGGVSTAPKGRFKAYVEMVKAGLAAARAVIWRPTVPPPPVPVGPQPSAAEPVIATPIYPNEDQILARSIHPPNENGSNLRALYEAYQAPSRSGWRTRYKG